MLKALVILAAVLPVWATAAVLPQADLNGDLSEQIRVVYRQGTDTVLAPWDGYAHALPAGCDVTLDAGNSMADMSAAINNTANDVICVSNGANLGTSVVTVTRTTCPNPIWVLREDYAAVDPSSFSWHPSVSDDADRPRTGGFNFNNTGNCLYIFYGVYINESWPTTFSLNCPSSQVARFIVSHSAVHGGISMQGCRGTQYGVHYSVVTTDTAAPKTDRECVRSSANIGGLGVDEGNWVTHNELRDCHGDWWAGGAATGYQNGGAVIAYNFMSSTATHKMDCVGNAVTDNDAYCHAGENAIDVKVGNTGDDCSRYILVQGNKIWGFRSNDDEAPDGGGSGSGSTGVFEVQRQARCVVIRENTVWDSHMLLASSNSGDDGGPYNLSLVNNTALMRVFDIDGTEPFCKTANPPGPANCSGFNVGMQFNIQNNGRYAFNTVVWDILTGYTPSYIKSNGGGRAQQFLGNVFVNGGAPNGTIGGNWEIDCNSYENTTTMPDATVSYNGGISRGNLTFWVDPITNPRQITLANVVVDENDPNIADCAGVTADINGFGSAGNDGISN